MPINRGQKQEQQQKAVFSCDASAQVIVRTLHADGRTNEEEILSKKYNPADVVYESGPKIQVSEVCLIHPVVLFPILTSLTSIFFNLVAAISLTG